jgi:hypothetical protein
MWTSLVLEGVETGTMACPSTIGQFHIQILSLVKVFDSRFSDMVTRRRSSALR